MNQTTKNIAKFLLISSAYAFCTELLAAETDASVKNPDTISDMANNLKSQFSAIGDLILGTARVAGIGFTVAAIFKFKQHKDNPTQVTIGTPFALLAVGVMLMFMKNIFEPAGKSIYGKDASFDGFSNDGTSTDASK